MLSLVAVLALLSSVQAAAKPSITVVTITSTIVPDYFQIDPEELPLSTATGPPPFLAQTNPAPFASVTYIPPSPLETQEPISGNTHNGNIFQQMGNLSPYFPSPGFGVDEYPLPAGAKIVWLNMLSRHGSRYPTEEITLASALSNATGKAKFTGALEFLNTWKYTQGVNILSPWGRQELYDSGVLHNYLYGQLYNPAGGEKLLVRTTTQDRMIKSAENFLAGFFGLGWTANATIEVILDDSDPAYNNSLAGYNACPNNNNFRSTAGLNASNEWIGVYTANALKRFQAASSGFNWTSAYINEAQQICSYETVTLGYSEWCQLFTYQEWLDFEQSIDIDFSGTYGFQSPTGRAVGVGYVEEVLARLTHHYITQPTGSDNITLDSMPSTFPLHQALNLDFTHDVNIAGVLTAFGLTQFAAPISTKEYQANRSLIVSHMEPFGARLDIELIQTPQPVTPYRSRSGSQYAAGGNTTYIHFLLNQRTVPLGRSLPACGDRADGWCELSTFLNTQARALEQSDYAYACKGDYPAPAYGAVTDGVPPAAKS